MKNTGVVRRLDELGRITLPMELRKVFNIEERDSLEIYVEDDKIILKKYYNIRKTMVIRKTRNRDRE